MDYYHEPPTFEAELRGVSFRPIEAKAVVKDLVVGDPLKLEPDPKNEYDPNAIKVIEINSGEFIGFVAAEVAVDMAEWIAQGWTFECKVSHRVSAAKVLLEIYPVAKPDAAA